MSVLSLFFAEEHKTTLTQGKCKHKNKMSVTLQKLGIYKPNIFEANFRSNQDDSIEPRLQTFTTGTIPKNLKNLVLQKRVISAFSFWHSDPARFE